MTSHLSSKQREQNRQNIRQTLRHERNNLETLFMQEAEQALADNIATFYQQNVRASPSAATELPAAPDQPPGDTVTKIGGYWAVGGEISLKTSLSWLRDNHCLTYLPVISGTTLLFAPLSEQTLFNKGKYNIDIPCYQQDQALKPEHLRIVMLPLLGFDLQGNRLGMGGGYYDRSLAYRLQAVANSGARKQHSESQLLIGIAYEFQRCDSVPAEPWDVPLDMVITEQNIYHCDSNS